MSDLDLAATQTASWRIVTGARARLEAIDTIAMLTADDDYAEVRAEVGLPR